MVRVLLDTCVISELRRSDANQRVTEYVQRIDAPSVHMSAVTFGELVAGIALLPTGKKKRELSSWLLSIEQDYGDRILPVDTEVARIWSQITAQVQSQGFHLHASDGLIAATAIRHGMFLVTRNIKHFDASGAQIVNPWES
jgi:predicted nucleic acid-binding protein